MQENKRATERRYALWLRRPAAEPHCEVIGVGAPMTGNSVYINVGKMITGAEMRAHNVADEL